MDDDQHAAALADRVRDALALADTLDLSGVALHLNNALIALDGVGDAGPADIERSDAVTHKVA